MATFGFFCVQKSIKRILYRDFSTFRYPIAFEIVLILKALILTETLFFPPQMARARSLRRPRTAAAAARRAAPPSRTSASPRPCPTRSRTWTPTTTPATAPTTQTQSPRSAPPRTGPPRQTPRPTCSSRRPPVSLKGLYFRSVDVH